jgi:CDGSH-type Zn-finger protein
MAVLVNGLKNGPSEISGAVTVLGYKAKSMPMSVIRFTSVVAASQNKPYCDGSHTVGRFLVRRNSRLKSCDDYGRPRCAAESSCLEAK